MYEYNPTKGPEYVKYHKEMVYLFAFFASLMVVDLIIIAFEIHSLNQVVLVTVFVVLLFLPKVLAEDD